MDAADAKNAPERDSASGKRKCETMLKRVPISRGFGQTVVGSAADTEAARSLLLMIFILEDPNGTYQQP